MILETFCREEVLCHEYLSTRSGGTGKVDVRSKLRKAMAGDSFDHDLASKLEKISSNTRWIVVTDDGADVRGF